MERPEKQRAIGKKYTREIFSRLPLKIQLTLSEVSRWLPQLEKLKNGAWRPFIVGVLACHMAACQPTRGFEDQTPPSPTPIVEPYHPQPTPELTPTSPLEPTPTPEPTPMATPGPTISGETLTIGDSQLELREFDGEEIAQLINASEKGWQVITNDKGKISFFSGYAGEAGKESQVVVLAQGPEDYQWNPDNQLWQKDNQVVIPDILLPGGWNEEKQMAGPAYEADIVFLFKDNGNYRIGVVYNPEKVAQISDKSNLEILPDGSGLYVGSPKNYELQEGQQMIRDEDGNLRLTNADGSYLLMRTSWSQVTSPNQLYQAGTFAGPFETQPTLPYPTDEIVQELGITNYQVVDNHYIALHKVVDQQTGETRQYIIAQATTNKEGKFTGWQRTLPFDVESGLVVPHPQETNPELFNLEKSDAPIPQFVNAMRMGGIEVHSQEVANNLQYKIITGADGKQYVIGTFNLDPNPKKKGETLEGPIPLMIAQKNENGRWKWKEITTLDLADLLRIPFGGMIENHEDPKLTKLIKKNFNFVTITSPAYFSSSVNSPLNFEHEDYQLQYAKALGFKSDQIMLGPAICPADIPKGFEKLTNQEARKWFVNFIKTYMSRYKNKAKYYVLINEIHNDPTGILTSKIPDYVELAFTTARETNPDAFLIFNQTANYDPRFGKYVDITSNFGNNLYKKGLLDAVGVQGHLYEGGVKIEPDEKHIDKAFSLYQAPIFLTELDADMHNVGGNRLITQAKWYQQIINSCLKTNRCAGINLWGTFPDKRSWYEVVRGESDADATPWDDNYNNKPAYYGITQSLYFYLLNQASK